MKPKLNILFICSWYPSRVLKSNGDFIQRHAKAVVLQHNVTVIHVKTDKNTVNKIEITDHIINNVRTLIAYVKPSKNPILKISRFINAYKKLVQKAGSFDVIHVHKFYPAGFRFAH